MTGEVIREAVKLPWFRLYVEAVDDEKLRLLSFEDRWHFVALLCCKGQGILDEGGPLLYRKVAVKLGVTKDTLEEIARRLAEVDLIDAETLQPTKWGARQFRSDSDAGAAERKRRQRERERAAALAAAGIPAHSDDGHGNVTRDGVTGEGDGHAGVTRTDTDTEADTDAEGKHIPPGGGAPPAGGASVSDEGEDKDGTRKRPLSKAFLVREGVKAQHAADWLAARRAKRLPLTLTAWEGVCVEAERAGLTTAQAVHIAAAEGWGGFKAKWLETEEKKSGGQWWTSDVLALAKALQVGAGPARRGESNDQWHARIRAAIDNGGEPPAPRAQPVTPLDPVPSADEARSGPSDASRAAMASAMATLRKNSFGAPAQ